MRWGRGTIVVGAGVVGLSAAYYLAALGEMVTVLDRGFPGTGASGDNLGQLSLMDRDERMQFSWCMESIALYRELEEEEGIDTERNECGGLLLLGTEEQREIALSLVHSHQKRGLQVGFLDTKGIKDIEPHFDAPSLLGALYCPREGSIMPLKTLNGLTEAARRRGVSFRLNR
jgi:glycine/D-amino acid oxidase-like deaminating enzyme